VRLEIRVYWKGITKNSGQNPYLKYLKEKLDLVRFRLVCLSLIILYCF